MSGPVEEAYAAGLLDGYEYALDRSSPRTKALRATVERVVALALHEGRQCGRWGHHFGSSRCRAFELAQERVDHIMAAVAAGGER